LRFSRLLCSEKWFHQRNLEGTEEWTDSAAPSLLNGKSLTATWSSSGAVASRTEEKR